MRHLFKCLGCGEVFEKKTADDLCPDCLAKPPVVVKAKVKPKWVANKANNLKKKKK